VRSGAVIYRNQATFAENSLSVEQGINSAVQGTPATKQGFRVSQGELSGQDYAAAEASNWLASHNSTLDKVWKLLAVGRNRRPYISDELRKIAMERSINWCHSADIGRAKAQRRDIAQFVTRLQRVSEKLPDIESDYRLAIEGLTRETSAKGQGLSLNALNADIERVAVAAQTFLDQYSPTGIKTNIALERAASALIHLIEGELGRTIAFSMNADAQSGAEPRTNAARAMVIFLQAIGPKTTTTAIANMVVKLRSDPVLARLPFDEILDAEFPTPPGEPASED
jgi:hypothetical protein